MASKPTRISTRALLIEAARTELGEGNGELEVAKVAKRAGVSDGLTYYHFGNKSGLLNAVVNDFYSRLDDQVIAIQFEGATWAEREKARVYAMVTFFYEDPVAIIVATRLRTDPAFAADEAKRNSRIEVLGARNIQQAQKNGEIDASHNSMLLVAMILAGATTGIRTALSTDPPVPLEQAQKEIWTFVARSAGLTTQT